jgi:hypothetical protein
MIGQVALAITKTVSLALMRPRRTSKMNLLTLKRKKRSQKSYRFSSNKNNPNRLRVNSLHKWRRKSKKPRM